MKRPPLCPPRVYAIADAGALGARSVPDAVAAMASAGMRWIQIRGKELSGRAWYEIVDETTRRLAGFEARLWIDDRVDVASLFEVAGVHVGQEDLPPARVRAVVGDRLWIGCSTHNPQQLAAADADPDVDLVAIGPVFATTGKANPDPVIGLAGVERARRKTDKPLVAIGGIDAESLPAVLDAGADTVAVIGAVCRSGDIEKNCRRLLAAAA